MQEKTVTELKQMIDSGVNFQLIDVREPHEFEICNLNGKLIPMNEVPEHIDEIAKDVPVVIHCRSGARCGRICQYLETEHGYTNLFNLKGGILAWANQIDPTMPKY